MKKLFKITDFSVEHDDNEIIATLDTQHVCHIPLNKFERWLKQTDRLEWVHEYSDNTGDHIQETGRYTMDQYWGMSRAYLKYDIYEFIGIHFIDPFTSIKESIIKINREYAR